VDEERAIRKLPETHAAAIRLRARGFDDTAIAAELDLPPESIAQLLRIADEKLKSLTTRPGPHDPADSEAMP